VSDENPKKASELLVELNHKVDLILGLVKNQDQLLKILNNKIKNNLPENLIDPEKSENIVGIKENGISIRLNDKVVEQVAKNNEVIVDNEFVQVETVSTKKVAVQQKVTYSDGKNVCLASVEITGGNLKSSKKLKTNAMGKWMLVLEPGKYIVNINKSKNQQNTAVSISYPFTIEESDKPIELPPISQ